MNPSGQSSSIIKFCVPCRKKRVEMRGNAIQAIRKEMIRLAAMVSDSALKKTPVTPERNANGAKMIIVAADEPMSGRVNSAPHPAPHLWVFWVFVRESGG